MTYSNKNPAWGRLNASRHDDRIQEEARLAAQYMEQEPALSRSEALRLAARRLEAEARRAGR